MKKKLILLCMLIFTFSGGLMLSGSRNVDAANTKAEIKYQAHVQNIGWQNYVKNGELSGTTGKGLRVESFRMKLENLPVSGDISYATHVQNIGWQAARTSNQISGTTGQSLRMEAMRINLTGEIAKQYDVYYRTHVQDAGWLGWAKNGENAGSEGRAFRMEAIEVKLVKKGEVGIQTGNAFLTKPAPTPTPTPTKTNGEKVVEFARKQLGVPYLWAGTTPAGFDCSGLTQYVYKQALGKDIGRVTTNQENAGTVISLNNAQPGDLVFWGAKGSTYHVGIYIGNGNYIHSPKPGQKVHIQSFTWYKPHFAVRVK